MAHDITTTYLYRTPAAFDDLVVTGDAEALTGLHFAPKGAQAAVGKAARASLPPPLREACRWLDIYFSGRAPDFLPPYRLEGATPFRRAVCERLLHLPFGATATYGDIAREMASLLGVGRMSAQAVGGAVGWNPVCLVIPCHRVVGAGGALTGYGGGLANKAALLAHEGARLEMSS